MGQIDQDELEKQIQQSKDNEQILCRTEESGGQMLCRTEESGGQMLCRTEESGGQILCRIKKNREKYMGVKIPEEGFIRMKAAIEQAKQEKRRRRRRICRQIFGVGLAASFALICLIPNCSEASAKALKELPVIGRFFEVITIRNYQFDDGHSSADVQIPQLLNEERGPENENSALEDINRSVEEYTGEILERFKENQKILGDQGHQSLDISYKTLTDTRQWFTLEITVTEVQGSGFEYKRYYHIDKSTGKIASLRDLFLPDSNYLEVISGYIKSEMEKYNKESGEGEVYWIGKNEFTEGYEGIGEEQNFYLDNQNQLVIVFDEYEVAPGYMGMPQFQIPQKLIADMRRF